jgi:hypothetical protein
MRHRRIQLVLLACDERDARTELAERLRDLQAKPSRPAGDERRAAVEIEQLPDSHDFPRRVPRRVVARFASMDDNVPSLYPCIVRRPLS